MGASNSKLEKQLGALPEGERYFGLENFGNTCYCNSVLQTLYFCRPFRDRLLTYASSASRDSEENILTCLADLFVQISTQRKKTGVISPKRFVQRLKREKEQFRSYDEHQDAHELLLDLLNEISELLEAEQKAKQLPAGALPAASQLHPLRRGAAAAAPLADAASSSSQPSTSSSSAVGGGAVGGGGSRKAVKTWVHDLFQGKEVHETRCLQCETVTTSENVFYHLSLAITQNCSLTSCLRNFSSTDTLQGGEKFFCNECGCLQEAQKRTKLKELPRVLFLHLNRFKYTTHMDRDSYVRVQRSKLMYRVVFPFELKLRDSAADDCADPDAEYHLFAVIVHVGSGLDHGHYVALVKSHNMWLFFEDDSVEPITEAMVQSTFGSTQEFSGHVGHGYILMYEKQPQGS